MTDKAKEFLKEKGINENTYPCDLNILSQWLSEYANKVKEEAEKERYFLVFWIGTGGVYGQNCIKMIDGKYPSWRWIKDNISHEGDMVLTNIIEVNEQDFNDFNDNNA